MFLNTIQASEGSRKKAKRVGRGIGSTLGKTCGRGHKGQKSRKKKYAAEVRLHELNGLAENTVDLQALVNANIVPAFTKTAKIIKSGEVTKPVTVQGIKVTAGAKAAIEAAGGKVEA